jgi:hypothetical protein
MKRVRRIGPLLGLAAAVLSSAASSCPTSPAQSGLVPADSGQLVHDLTRNVYWLRDANFAASSQGQAIQAQMGVTGITPNGAMDYPTAQAWVAALNAMNGGQGYLGHQNWQLPATPMKDSTCGAMGPQGASFGGLCRGNPLGNLYYRALNDMLPDNVAPGFGVTIGPIQQLQLSYYWTSAAGGIGGAQVFSFTGLGDATTTNDSYYYVLPEVPAASGPIGGVAPTCAPGTSVTPYVAGPAAGQAVYDCVTGITWLANANLAATNPLGLTGNVPGGITEKRPYPSPRPTTIAAPLIKGGAMLWSTAKQWVAALDSANAGTGYLGSAQWQLPASAAEMRALYQHLQLAPGDARLAAHDTVGAFLNLQPFFYWEVCEPDPSGLGGTSADCAQGNAPPSTSGAQMNFDFTFGYGIQATDLAALRYFVMVYFPGT